uniref:Alpha-macroglobulin receptor-binding domain-containing protein n=1 Tax=Anopheles culicifacies TaxID=139723 RepID=A0A182ME87_9DIPT
MNKKADIGSKKIEFQLTPNLLTSVVDNLDNLLAVPSGCGEQNMVRFVPNIVVLDYLHAIGSKEQKLFDKATKLLHEGYQNQMRYRQSDGSFGVWQSGGSVFLTAFVAKSMQTASKYITEVDPAMVEKAYGWLAARQLSSGRFDELESINNPYDLAIATYALMLNGHSMKDNALKKLIDKSTVTNNGTERYWHTTNSIETTAYALLSFVIAEKYLDGIPVMKWLVNQRYVTGSFPRTQDTFVGLKALTKLAEKISPARNEYTVDLRYKKKASSFRINSQDIATQNFLDIPEDTKLLEINVGGIGFGLLQVVYQYSLNLENFKNRFTLVLDKQNTGSDYELRLRVCASFIPELADSRSNMALVEVNFPSGYVVDRNPISEQTTVNPIQNIEIRYGGTSVVVYYDNMGAERNCFTVTAYRRFKVAMRRPAYVVVYDYYDLNLNAIQKYEVDKQELICDICEGDDCSKDCKEQ